MSELVFAALMQLGAAAIKSEPVVVEWWKKVHASAKQDLPLDAQQDADLDALLESRKTDPNWDPNQNQ